MEAQQNAEKDTFGVTITAQMRHAVLWEACKKLGSAKALATHLGISETVLGRWVNLRAVPRRTRLRREVAQRLMEVTQQTIDELFPEPLASQDFLDLPKEVEQTRWMNPHELAAVGLLQRMPQPDEAVERRELQLLIRQAMDKMPARHQAALRLRFGLDGEVEHSWDGIAQVLGVSSERARQIVKRGLMRLRRSPLVLESHK